MFKWVGSEKVDGFALSLLWIVFSLALMVLPKVFSIATAPHYWLTPSLSWLSLAIYVLLSFLWLGYLLFFLSEKWENSICLSGIASYLLVILGAFYADMLYLDGVLRDTDGYAVLNEKIIAYLAQEKGWYGLLFMGLSGHVILFKKRLNKKQLKIPTHVIKIIMPVFLLLIPFLVAQPLLLINVQLFIMTKATLFSYLPFQFRALQNSLYALFMLGSLAGLMMRHQEDQLDLSWHKKINKVAGHLTACCLLFQSVLGLLPYLWLAHRTGQSAYRWMVVDHVMLMKEALTMIPLLFTLLVLLCFKKKIRNRFFDDTTDTHNTTGHFGSARWALTQDLMQLNAYRASNGIPVGMDQQGKLLYLPLCNKLTISPPGGGKTTASSMLVLLTHPGPVFVWDIKGELWAVTVNYRTRVLKRQVIVIDPYGLTKSPDFAKDKEKSLLQEYTINPFDWIPEDTKQRDRILNTLAAAFVVNEGGTATHFDDNAKILIRGYIDYLMNQRALPMRLGN